MNTPRLTIETLRRDTGAAGIPAAGSSGWRRSTPTLADAVQMLQKAERGTLRDERGRSYTVWAVLYIEAEADDIDADPFAPDFAGTTSPEPAPEPAETPAPQPDAPAGLFDNA